MKSLRKQKKMLSILLAIMMLVSMPAAAFAESDALDPTIESSEAVQDEVQEETPEETSEAAKDTESTTEETKENEEVSDEKAFEVKNKEYGVVVSIPEDAMPKDVDKKDIGVEVKDLTEKDTEKYLELIDKDESALIKALDISLVNKETGNEIQPTGEVTVTVPEVEEAGLEVDVHRIDSAKKATKLDSVVENNSEVVFDTAHFTPYIISTLGAGNFSSDGLQEKINEAVAAGETDIVVSLPQDIWNWGKTIVTIPSGVKVTIKSSDGQPKELRRESWKGNDCVGTMFMVREGGELILEENIELVGDAHEYTGNGGYSVYGDTGVRAEGDDVRGVFVHNEGKLVINGAKLRGAKTEGSNAAEYVSPIYTTGSKAIVELNSGEISGTKLRGNANNGGNRRSAGGIIVANDANFIMNGGSIINNDANYSEEFMPHRLQDDLFTKNTGNGDVHDNDGTAKRMSAWRGYLATPEGLEDVNHSLRSLTKGSKLEPKKGTLMEGTVTEGTDVKKTCSAGAVLLLTGGNMEMNGGQIKNNKGDVGGIGVGDSDPWAVSKGVTNVYNEPIHKKSTFDFKGGWISGNEGIFTGAVYVAGNSVMNMGADSGKGITRDGTGPTIRDNKAVIHSAGITLCTVKSGEDHPVLNMSNGFIYKNHTAGQGGGILVKSNNAHITGGVIEDNVAEVMGGGIYVDVGYTMNIDVATAITENVANSAWSGDEYQYNSDYVQSRIGAGAGGGVWMCPEGTTRNNVLGLMYVYNNRASAAGDDVYKNVQAGVTRKQAVEVPKHDYTGNEVTWYRDGGIKDYSENHITSGNMEQTSLVSVWDRQWSWNNNDHVQPLERYDRYSDNNFRQSFDKANSAYDAFALKMVPGENNSLSPEEIIDQAQLVIRGNESSRGGGIGTNGVIHFGHEKEYEVSELKVKKDWDPTLQAKTEPITISPYVIGVDGKKHYLPKFELNDGNSWAHVMENLPRSLGGTRLFYHDSKGFHTNIKFEETPGDYLLMVHDFTHVITTQNKEHITEYHQNESYTITRNNAEYKVSLTNSPKGTHDVDLLKVAATEGDGTTALQTALEGATMRLMMQGEGSQEYEIDSWVSGTSAHRVKLPEGTYTLYEDRAPEGYLIADPIQFKVDASGKVSILKDGKYIAQSEATVTMVDETDKRKVRAIKTWEPGAKPQEITVTLKTKSGEVVQRDDNPAKLNADNNWTYTWENLPDDETQYVVEESAGNYKTNMNAIADSWLPVSKFDVNGRECVVMTIKQGDKEYYLVPNKDNSGLALKEALIDESGKAIAPPEEAIWIQEPVIVDGKVLDGDKVTLVNAVTGKKFAGKGNKIGFVDRGEAHDTTNKLNMVASVSTQEGVLWIGPGVFRWENNQAIIASNANWEADHTPIRIYQMTEANMEESTDTIQYVYIKNSPKKSNITLPLTGGTGLLMTMLLGVQLLLIALVMYLRRRLALK